MFTVGCQRDVAKKRLIELMIRDWVLCKKFFQPTPRNELHLIGIGLLTSTSGEVLIGYSNSSKASASEARLVTRSSRRACLKFCV